MKLDEIKALAIDNNFKVIYDDSSKDRWDRFICRSLLLQSQEVIITYDGYESSNDLIKIYNVENYDASYNMSYGDGIDYYINFKTLTPIIFKQIIDIVSQYEKEKNQEDFSYDKIEFLEEKLKTLIAQTEK